jgi:tetratricopeptide (TPR) repeat protein
VTQEFHISVTPLRNDEYLVRTERVAPGVPLAEEQVTWPIEDWLTQARQLMNDPLMGLLQGDSVSRIGGFDLSQQSRSANGTTSASNLSLIDLGQQLYSGLFQGTLRDSWMTARGIAQHRGEVLRLRLGLKGARLPRLPWEVLHGGTPTSEKLRQPDAMGPVPRPIAAGTDIVFSRYQPTGVMPASAQVAIDPDQPLRILMVIAAPTDQERLDLKREATHLQQELRRQSAALPEGIANTVPELQLTILDQPGREQLTQALEQGHYHVLHYAGHSNLGAAGGNLYLVNSKTGLTEILSGDDLAGLLVNNGVRMAVFNSCRGAYTAASDPAIEAERNLAEALVSRGIPAVLAMAEQIPDDVALTLTRLFYRNLKQGYPIDLSLSRARQGLISAYSSNQLYWALPILYLNSEFDGYLTSGDRSLDNPADRLLLLPQVYDASPVLAGEEDTYANAAALDGDDWVELSEAVLSEEDLNDLVDDLEYDDEFNNTFADEELSYEDDANVVSDLIQQLAHPVPVREEALSTFDEPAAAVAETNQPQEDASRSQNRINIPVIRVDEDTEAPTPVSTAASQTVASRSDADRSPSDWQLSPSGAVAAVSTGSRHFWQNISSHPRMLTIVGIAGVAAIGVLGFSLANRFFPLQSSERQLLEQVENFETATRGNSSPVPDASEIDLETAETSAVTEIAISHLNEDELAQGEQAVRELLDRGALPEAKAALAIISADRVDEPVVSFLLGRLAWQSVQVGDEDYGVDDARRYWETATRGDSPSPEYYNALGFAYYAEGQSREAIQAWVQALSLLEAQPSEASAATDVSSESDVALPEQPLTGETALTSYAGIALALQQASDQPTDQSTETEQRDMRSKAAKLHEMVLETNPVAFQPQELAKPENWVWTEAAIADWQSLSSTQP